MAETNEPFEPIEKLLVELKAASDAGVFGQTELSSPTATPQFTTGRFARRVIAAAAVLALFVGSWTVFYRISSPPRSPYVAVVASLDSCMNGPTKAGLTGNCTQQDRDADRDFDLRDFHDMLASAAFRH